MNQLTSFCYCISLRAGTVIIGLLYLVGALFSIGVLFAAIAYQFDLPEMNSFPFLEVFPVYFAFIAIGWHLKVPIYYIFAHSCLQVIVSIILVIGAAKRKTDLAAPWLVLNILSLVSDLLGIVAFCVGGFPSSPILGDFSFVAPLLVAIFYLTGGMYMINIVYSFHESLKNHYLVI